MISKKYLQNIIPRVIKASSMNMMFTKVDGNNIEIYSNFELSFTSVLQSSVWFRCARK